MCGYSQRIWSYHRALLIESKNVHFLLIRGHFYSFSPFIFLLFSPRFSPLFAIFLPERVLVLSAAYIWRVLAMCLGSTLNHNRSGLLGEDKLICARTSQFLGAPFSPAVNTTVFLVLSSWVRLLPSIYYFCLPTYFLKVEMLCFLFLQTQISNAHGFLSCFRLSIFCGLVCKNARCSLVPRCVQPFICISKKLRDS